MKPTSRPDSEAASANITKRINTRRAIDLREGEKVNKRHVDRLPRDRPTN